MKRLSRIYLVKIKDEKLRTELDGALGYCFSFKSDGLIADNLVCLFNLTVGYRFLQIEDAKKYLEYYFDDPVTLEQEKELMAHIRKISEYDIH